MKNSLIKILAFGCLSITTLAVPIAYNRVQARKLTLLEAFKDMADKISRPKARPVQEVEVTRHYDVRQHSIITSGRLDQFLGGVLKGKGQKFIEVARQNNICPIFFAAICMHESANGASKFSREKNNVFGIFKNGKYHSFENVDECIEFAGKLLGGRIYVKGGNYTVQKIQMIYCPVGAKNDPKGLNRYWLDGVLDKMVKLWGKKLFVTV
jgi:hypothetical protein